MILHCHGTALRPICLQKLGSLAATPSASRQKIWADRPTTMVGELGMLAMHLMVVFISMVVVNINITHVILLLLLLYKDDDDDGGDVQLPLNPIKHQCNVPFTLY